DAHSVKLDTYLQKVRLGGREPAIAGREVARLYTRHQSSAAYMLTRAGAFRYLELTMKAGLPADYALFPKNPRRAGLVVYQLVPAIAVQDHLIATEDGGRRFATAMAGPRGEALPRKRSPILKRLVREGVRILDQFPDFMELAYQKV